MLLLRTLLLIAFIAGNGVVFADAATQKMLDFQKRGQACGADVTCLQNLTREMQAEIGAAASTQDRSTLTASPKTMSVDSNKDPCLKCREHIAWMTQHGSVADSHCKPISVDLLWKFTQKQIRTPETRIGPSSSARVTLTESYPGCAVLTRYQNARSALSHAELGGPPSPEEAKARLTAVDAIYGLSRPRTGLFARGDEFTTVTSRDVNQYVVDLSRREFGLDYQCNDLPGAVKGSNMGTVLMPTIDVRGKKIVPAGNWGIMVNPELGYERAVDLGEFLSCRQIHSAFKNKTSVEHTFPFKQELESVVPSSFGPLKTVDSIDGTVRVRIGFDGATSSGNMKPDKEKKPGKLVVSSGALKAHRNSPKKKYQPRSKVYTLTNNGEKSIVFQADEKVSWLDIDTPQGTLPGGQSTTVTVALTDQADKLKPGRYQTKVHFKDMAGGNDVTREAVLSDIEKWRFTVIEKYDLVFGGGIVDGGISPPVRNIVSIELEGGKFKRATATLRFGKMKSVSTPAGVFQCDPDPQGTWIDQRAYSLKGWVQGNRVHLVFPKNAYHLKINCITDKDQLRDAYRNWYNKQRTKPKFKNIPNSQWSKKVEEWVLRDTSATVLTKTVNTTRDLYPGATGATHISVELKKSFHPNGSPSNVDYSSTRMERIE